MQSPLSPNTAAVADSVRAAADSTVEAVRHVGATLIDATFWFGIAMKGLRAAIVILVALLVLAAITRVKQRWVRKSLAAPTLDKRRQRVLTVADLLGSFARYAVWTLAGISILSIIGFDIRALLAGAGIAGLAIGFGAQTFVKDVISGFFLLFDDTLGNGDLIRFGDQAGTVEYVGLRIIKVRKFDGELLMIPAGELRTFGNKSIGFARVIVPVSLAYEQDVDQVIDALGEVAREWAATDEAKAIMVEEEPQVQALMDLGDSSVTARVVVQVKPGEQFAAERELRRLIKKRFDEGGIEIPFPRRTVYVKSDSSDKGDSGVVSATDAAAAAGADD